MAPPLDTNPVRRHLDQLRHAGKKALCQFLIAGDPTPEEAEDLAMVAIDAGVDLFEFCIPFPRSITDGPVVQAGYDRALAAGMTFERALEAMSRLAKHIPVVLLADYRTTIAPMGVEAFMQAAADNGAGAVLPHALPPLLQDSADAEADMRGLGIVSTTYPGSDERTVTNSARRGTAFLYLVSSYGRSGGRIDPDALAQPITRLREASSGPIAVGFGVRNADDHRAVYSAGADMTITGSALTGIIGELAGNRSQLRQEWCQALTEIARAKEDWKTTELQRRYQYA